MRESSFCRSPLALPTLSRTDAGSVRSFVIAALCKRGIHVLVKASTGEHMKANIEACKMEDHKVLDDPPFGSNDMVAMCGGSDAYAESFANDEGLPCGNSAAAATL